MRKVFFVAFIFVVLLFSVLMLPACSTQKNAQSKIDFIVDGELYATTGVVDGVIEKMPNEPEKEKYVFKGWFFDKDEWKKPLTIQSLVDLPIINGDSIKVYACFIEYSCDADGLSHDFVEIEECSATCVQDGKRVFKCKKCEYFYEETIPALNHDLGELNVIKAATCIVDGEGYRYCLRCKKNIDEIILHSGHKLDEKKHCLNAGCDYFELFDCSVTVNSIFETYTLNVALECGKPFEISPKVYSVDQLKFAGYFNGNEKISYDDGRLVIDYKGEKSLSITAKYYYSVAEINDLIDLQNNRFLSAFYKNQKNNTLAVEVENDLNFAGLDWNPLTVSGNIAFNGNKHIFKNYYSTKGGLFDTIGNSYIDCTYIKDIDFENVRLEITNLQKENNNYDSYHTIGVLANEVRGSVENVSVKTGSIKVEQCGDTDLAVAGICGSCRTINGCKNYVSIKTNTVLAGGIAINADNVKECRNYGSISTGEYIVTPALKTMGSFYGTAGICVYSYKVKDCVNYGNVSGAMFSAGGICCTALQGIENCSNRGKIVSENGYSAGIAVYSSYFNDCGEVKFCSNYGEIDGKKYVAGIACFSAFMHDCYNVGNIKSDEYAGGISANFTGLIDAMKYCYNIGTVRGGQYSGGITANANSSVLFKCVNLNSKFSGGEVTLTQCSVADDTDDPFIKLEYDVNIWQFTGNGNPILKWEVSI